MRYIGVCVCERERESAAAQPRRVHLTGGMHNVYDDWLVCQRVRSAALLSWLCAFVLRWRSMIDCCEYVKQISRPLKYILYTSPSGCCCCRRRHFHNIYITQKSTAFEQWRGREGERERERVLSSSSWSPSWMLLPVVVVVVVLGTLRIFFSHLWIVFVSPPKTIVTSCLSASSTKQRFKRFKCRLATQKTGVFTILRYEQWSEWNQKHAMSLWSRWETMY